MVEQIDKGIEVQDELGQATAEQMLEELENDVKAYEKALDKAEKDLENYTEQLEVDREIWKILEEPESIRVLNPTRGFEKSDRYWELMHKKQLFQIRADKAVADGQVKQMEQAIEFTKKALDNAKERLSKHKKDNLKLLALSKRNKEEE